ncbi:MAG TPA: phage protein Gp27 family protein [Verrucomicrobiae bacterium]|jgi:hypothetical protein|nr:phage protein Gp27 family protein [Verrucomicrobiae bacterium]
MARRGKIARLPKEIRDQLNRRLQNGEAGNKLVDWLNGLEEVQAILRGEFEGHPVNEPNLSDWRNGGYADWERMEAVRQRIEALRENSEGLTDLTGRVDISYCYSTLLAVKITELGELLLAKNDDPEEQWERVCKVHQQISRMRRDDDRRARTLIRQDKWGLQARKIVEEERKQPGNMTREERERRIKEIYATI